MHGLLLPKTTTNPQSPKRFRPMKLLVVLAVLIALGAVASFTILKTQHPEPKAKVAREELSPVATVTVQPVGKMQVKSEVVSSGTVAARHSVDIGAELSGLRVTEVNVDEGDFVHRGQILARMNSDLLNAQLSRERANLAGAIANVEKAKQPNRLEDILGLQAAFQLAQAAISQADANVKRGEANLANLRMIASRYKSLSLQGAVSDQDARDKQTAAQMAESELSATHQQLEASRFSAKQAQERLSAARAGGRQVDISISQATVGQIQAGIRQIEAQIAQSIVRAPSDGIITKRNAEVGEIPTLGQPLFTMAKDAAIELRAQVQEIDLPGVHAGANVIITPAAPGLKRIHATVREVSPVVDPRSRLGTVYIDVSARSGLKEGMYARSAIETGMHDSIAVPTKAIRAEENQKIVFILNGNKASRRPITIGTTAGDMVEVRSGLSEGADLIVAGAGFLKDGDVVTVSRDKRVASRKEEGNNGL